VWEPEYGKHLKLIALLDPLRPAEGGVGTRVWETAKVRGPCWIRLGQREGVWEPEYGKHLKLIAPHEPILAECRWYGNQNVGNG